jgi:DNA-binding ferritin-like protein
MPVNRSLADLDVPVGRSAYGTAIAAREPWALVAHSTLCGMTDDDADRPEPPSAKAITALLREARSLSRRADKLSGTAAAVDDPTTQQLAAEACTSMEQLVHHLMLLERQVQRGEKAAGRRAP